MLISSQLRLSKQKQEIPVLDAEDGKQARLWGSPNQFFFRGSLHTFNCTRDCFIQGHQTNKPYSTINHESEERPHPHVPKPPDET